MREPLEHNFYFSLCRVLRRVWLSHSIINNTTRSITGVEGQHKVIQMGNVQVPIVKLRIVLAIVFLIIPGILRTLLAMRDIVNNCLYIYIQGRHAFHGNQMQLLEMRYYFLIYTSKPRDINFVLYTETDYDPSARFSDTNHSFQFCLCCEEKKGILLIQKHGELLNISTNSGRPAVWHPLIHIDRNWQLERTIWYLTIRSRLILYTSTLSRQWKLL